MDLDNLVGNLRGEVGEVITTWLMMRHFMAEGAQLASGNPAQDMGNRQLAFLNLLADKLRDELTGRLSELAQKKTGQLTFYFAAKKLPSLEPEVVAFEAYVINHRIREKRNRDISHKELPEKWSDHRDLHIPYRVLLRGVAMVLRLMKRLDRQVLGASAPYCWREARKQRYDYMSPPRAGYMLIPYLRLSGEDRIRVLQEELREGAEIWSEMTTTINGHPATVVVCPKWGIIVNGDRLLALDEYPLQHMASIETGPSEPLDAAMNERDV